jgi:hypothetical protein
VWLKVMIEIKRVSKFNATPIGQRSPLVATLIV